jgi:hypothetical protein
MGMLSTLKLHALALCFGVPRQAQPALRILKTNITLSVSLLLYILHNQLSFTQSRLSMKHRKE